VRIGRRHTAQIRSNLVSRLLSASPAPLSPHDRDRHPFDQLLALGVGELNEQLRRVIPQTTTLLLSGETGTGKSRLARKIHDLSPRRDEPFLVVDCGVLSLHLIESEMFGHVKGAFTGADCDRAGKLAAAGRGTLLLDEISALPTALQGKLLRVMDDQSFEPVGSDTLQPLQARVIVISSVPLNQELVAGRFRADLYYRLNVVAFHLPPLREQRAAIVPLANRFLAEFTARNRPNIHGIGPHALTLLERYHWPGNIRELRNTIERAVALAPGPDIQPSDLPDNVRTLQVDLRANSIEPSGHAPLPSPVWVSDCLTLSQGTEQVEILKITEALRKHHNNRVRAAAELGISRMSLYKKLHKYRLFDMA